ncbi:unnamed protein product, partial [marine sediment metagenome]
SGTRIKLLTSDEYDADIDTETMTNGTVNFDLTMVTGATYYQATTLTWGATHYLTASVFSGVSLSTSTSSGVLVEPSTATKLQILLPGQHPVPGKVATYGKGGSISSLVAGTTYTVTVNLVDDYYNFQSSATMPLVEVKTTDDEAGRSTLWGYTPPELPLVNGIRTFDIRMFRSGSQVRVPVVSMV